MTRTYAITNISELDRYMAQIDKYPVLSPEDELKLAKRWRDSQDVAAAQALVTSNLRFVVKIANEYKGYGARTMDLVQEGSVGLMHAVKRFDPYKGYRLITYAVFWIRSYIHKFLMSMSKMVNFGSTRAHRKLFFKLKSYKAMLGSRSNLTEEEILDQAAEDFEINRDEVEEINQYMSGADASLDAPSDESGKAMVEIMPSSQVNQEDELARLEQESDMNAQLQNALEMLNQREREVVEARYLSDTPEQLNRLGDRFGVSKQRVAQIEKRALEKLRESLDFAA